MNYKSLAKLTHSQWQCATAHVKSPTNSSDNTVALFKFRNSLPILSAIWSPTEWVSEWVILRPTASRPVYFGVKHPFGAFDQILLLSANCGFVDVGRPLWREVVVCLLLCTMYIYLHFTCYLALCIHPFTHTPLWRGVSAHGSHYIYHLNIL
jgi:hypothetical protein